MPIQAPQWTDYLNCPVCCREFGASPRSPISLGCGHTLCRHCLLHLHRKQCPFDQTSIQVEPDELVVNTALLQLAGYTPPAQPYHPPSIQALSEQDRHAYDVIVRCMENLAIYLKFCGNANSSMAGNRLSRPMQRKLVTLLQCAMTDEEGRGRAARAARSLGERTVTELILQHQNPQQLSANLWAAVRARGCQFLGPAMQEEVLKLVLLALEDGSALSRKVLVMFVVQRLEPHFPQASKTSIGHVVQLLYRASCFKVSKRECDSSLMQLKEEFRTYESLRREHDAQIVQIATEAGLRIAPDQWSALLYGDTTHKSHMQSIIDKLQTPQSFAQSVQELFLALQRTGDPAQLVVMNMHLDRLASIDASPGKSYVRKPTPSALLHSKAVREHIGCTLNVRIGLSESLDRWNLTLKDLTETIKMAATDAKSPSWQQLAEVMSSLKEVVSRLIQYLQEAGRDANHNQKHAEPSTSQPSPLDILPAQYSAASTPTHSRYKVSMCRDAATRSFCPRGNACTFAHSEEELERYRSMPVSVGATGAGAAATNGNFYLPPPPLPQSFPVPPPLYPCFPVPPPPLDNCNVQPLPPPMVQPLPPELLPVQEFQEPSHTNGMQPANYPPPMLHNQPPPMLNQNGIMIQLAERPYYGRFGNMIPMHEEVVSNHQFRPPDFPPPVFQNPMYQNMDECNIPIPNIYVTVPHEQQRNISPAYYDDLQLPEYRLKPFMQRESRPDPPWAANNDVFNFDGIRDSMPHCSSTTDDQELEEELQALERRIDTEFKSAD